MIALLDANVLYPAALRDLLLYLAVEKLYQPRWTDTIHEEWIRNVLKNRPELSPARLARTRSLMNESISGSLVTGFETLIPALELPDPDDRHVLAAAIKSCSDVIVTYNLKDFPESTVLSYNLNVWHPDQFLSYLLLEDQSGFLRAVKKQRSNLSQPPVSSSDLLAMLGRLSLRKTVKQLEPFADSL